MRAAVLILLCLASPAAAARVESGWFEFPFSEQPHWFEWTLSGEGVPPVQQAFWLATYHGVTYTTATYDQPQRSFVRADWQTALNDPLYTVSTVTLDGLSQSGPLVRVGGPFQLELFFYGMLTNGVFEPVFHETLTPFMIAMDTAELPEPPTCMLFLSGLVLKAWGSRRRVGRPDLRHR